MIMKTKISIFITIISLLLLGATNTTAQGTKAYFKKNGETIFQSPISDIDSIFFEQDTTKNLFISLDPSDPLLFKYTQENRSVNFYGSRDDNGIPSQVENIFIQDENDKITMQIYLDELERPSKFITEDISLFCEYVSDKVLITLITKEGMIYSGEMDFNFQNGKNSSYSFRSQNNIDRKCTIQVTNCGQPVDNRDVSVELSLPYMNDFFLRNIPATNIGGGLYECTIPHNVAGSYINLYGICEWVKEKSDVIATTICYIGGAVCLLLPGADVGCVLFAEEIKDMFCVGEGVPLETMVKFIIEIECEKIKFLGLNKDFNADMKLTPHLNALPSDILGESVIISADDPVPNLSIKMYYDCDINITPTLIMSNIQKTSASAYVNAIGFSGSIDEIGVCYSLSNSNPTIENGGTIKQQKTYGFGSATSLLLNNLQESTKYYIRPFMKKVIANNESYVYGDVQNFTTLAYDCEDFDNPQGVVINGVRWATHNVGASSPCDYGNYYQYNKGTTDFLLGNDYWNSVYANANSWLPANDPSPAGWRVPTLAEIQKLCDTNNVISKWITLNGVNGAKLTDRATGNSIFLPATGFRNILGDGSLSYVGSLGYYWSSTPYYGNSAYILDFGNGPVSWAGWGGDGRLCGFYIRSVAE